MKDRVTKANIQSYLDNRPIVNEYLGLISGKTLKLYPKALIRFERLTKTNIEDHSQKSRKTTSNYAT